MRILLSGASGLVGTALSRRAVEMGTEIVRLERRREAADGERVYWDPARAELDRAGLEGFDAVVHLAGEPVAGGRWTAARKARIYGSRVAGTRLLCEALAGAAQPPRVLVSASAIGFYGHRGAEVLDEKSAPGDGFLAHVCRDWEAAVQPAADAGIRVVCLRLGMVLSGEGGALAKMLAPFRAGLGGILGDGTAWTSWITIEDLVRAILFCIETPHLNGAVNAVAPNPVSNREFTKALGRVLRRPTVIPMPAAMVRTVFGEMGTELLLASTRVVPRHLEEAGFKFLHPDVEAALRAVLLSPK